MTDNGQLFLIDKPINYSSARVVNLVKKILNVRKAGHAGTLDPLATGLLIVGTGKKTKELHNFLGCDKEYSGIIEIGATTKSFDMETEISERVPVDKVSDEDIYSAAEKLTGELNQLPPMYSAVKYKGKPLYKFARKNIDIKREVKKIIIKEFIISKIEKPEIEFRVTCSKGTYIRSLANDFGEILGVGAYLKKLRRTKIGELSIDDAMTIEQFRQIYNFQEMTTA